MTTFSPLEVINLDTGLRFGAWTQATVQDDFLTPCSSFDLEASSESYGIDLARQLAADARVQIRIDGRPVITGYVDECSISASRGSGQSVRISGRDVLSSVVDGYIDPTTKIEKGTTIGQLLDQVLNRQFGLGVTFTNANTQRLANALVASPPPAWSKSKHNREDPIKEFKPRDNEGAFQFLSRVLTRHGYWIWCTPDGTGIVVAGPNYDGKATLALTRSINAPSRNNILDATAKTSVRDVPSHLYVRGTDATRGQKGKVLAVAQNKLSRRFKPIYLSDGNAVDQQTAERVAALQIARKLREFFTYEATIAGFRDVENGGLIEVDALVDVRDDLLGVHGTMWVESRTFTQSRGGTTTKLKLIPRNTLVLDYEEAAPVPQRYEDALAGITPALAPVVSGAFAFNGTTFYGKA